LLERRKRNWFAGYGIHREIVKRHPVNITAIRRPSVNNPQEKGSDGREKRSKEEKQLWKRSNSGIEATLE
jgi:hypothetical protein